jgi:hypothetical protein
LFTLYARIYRKEKFIYTEPKRSHGQGKHPPIMAEDFGMLKTVAWKEKHIFVSFGYSQIVRVALC